MNKRAPLLVLIATLPACSLFGPHDVDVEIREKATPVVCDLTARPDALDLIDTPPSVVLNTETEIWGFWFDPELYGALAENLQAMRRWMNQSSSIRGKLVKCIDDHNARAASPSSPSDP